MSIADHADLAHYPVNELADCKLVVFDLDGTIYTETHHFDYFKHEIERRMSLEARAGFQRDLQRSLSGQHTLKYGVMYDVDRDVIVYEGEQLTWEGSPVTVTHSGEMVHRIDVEDTWDLYRAIARHYRLGEQDLQESFLATRAYQESPAFVIQEIPGLKDSIRQLQDLGWKFCLMTNSPEKDSRVILGKIGLSEQFDAFIFNADKPYGSPQSLAKIRAEFGVRYEQMMSIGDHLKNDIQPAAALGMKTVYINAHAIQRKLGATAEVGHPAQVVELLRAVHAKCLSADRESSGS